MKPELHLFQMALFVPTLWKSPVVLVSGLSSGLFMPEASIQLPIDGNVQLCVQTQVPLQRWIGLCSSQKY